MSTIFVKNAKGVTLVELMIALALSSFLVIGVIQIYLDSRQTDDMGGALARIQETGRVALDIITKDIRSMGYLGCLNPKTLGADGVKIYASNAPLSDITLEGLRGYKVGGSWADGTEFDNTEIESKAKANSDVVAIMRVTSASEPVVRELTTDSVIALASNNLGIAKDDLVLVANCQEGYLFRVSDLVTNDADGTVLLMHDENQNTVSKFGVVNKITTDPSKVSVMQFMSNAYFVADSGRKNASGDAVFALYRQRDNLLDENVSSFEIEELLEGVETLQVLYGERLDGDRIRFVPANTPGLEMSSVESVRVGVLVASTQNVQQSNDLQTYLLPGGEVAPEPSDGLTHPADRRIRRAFSMTIQLRNRPNTPNSN